jgi:hypothetical protein
MKQEKNLYTHEKKNLGDILVKTLIHNGVDIMQLSSIFFKEKLLINILINNVKNKIRTLEMNKTKYNKIGFIEFHLFDSLIYLVL